MQCQRCQQRPANVHIVQVNNGVKREEHVCQQCAAQMGLAAIGSLGQSNPLEKIFPNLFTPEADPETDRACPRCGYSCQELRESGRLGCGECYHYFNEELQPVLQRIHNSLHHHGKIPQRLGGALGLKRQLDDLRNQLARCVLDERFEEAAQLRDQIRELEKRGE